MATRVSELLATLRDDVSARAKNMAGNLGDAATSADNLNASLKRTSQTQDQFTRSNDSVERSQNRSNAAFDSAQQKIERVQQLYQSGAISAEKYRDMVASIVSQYERVEAREQKNIDNLRQKSAELAKVINVTGGASDAAGKHANAVKLESYQIGMLTDEFHKWIDQVLSGGSAIQATIYQAPNMIQAMGGVSDALSLLRAGIVGPMGIVGGIGLAVGGFAVLAAAGEAEAAHLSVLSQHLRATRDDYASMGATAESVSRQIAARGELSLDDSRSTVETFAAVPTVDASQLDRLAHDARDVATVLGETVPDAAKMMATALRDPTRAAQDLAQNGLLGVNQSLVLQIEHLQESGHQMEAFNVFLGQLEHAAAGAHDQGLTPLQQGVEALGTSFSAAKEAMHEFLEPFEGAALRAVTDTVNQFAALALIARDLAHLRLPTFSDGNPSTAVAGSAAPVGTSSHASPSTTGAWQDQHLNASLANTDSSIPGQYAAEQRAIEGLNADLDRLRQKRAAGLVTDAEYSTDLQNLNGQLNQHAIALAGLKTPYQDLIEQQGKTAASAAALTGYQRAMVEVDQQVDDAVQRSYGRHATLAERMTAEAGTAHMLADQYNVSTAAILRNVTAQDAIAQAWQSGGAEAAHAINYWSAYNDALDHFSGTADGFAQAVSKRTQALDALTQAQNAVRLGQQTSQNEDQVAYLTAETRSIGLDSDARAVMLAHMQAEQDLRRQGRDLLSADRQAYLDSVDAVSRATQAYQHQQEVLSDLTGSLSSMADTVSGDVTQALIQGAGAGVNFQSVLQGIESQVVTMIAKLALINPLLNEIDGGTRNTLGDVAGLLGGSSSSSSVGNPFGEADGSASSSGSSFSIGQLFNMRQGAASSGNPFAEAGSYDVNDTSEQVTAIGQRASSSGFSFGGLLGGVAGGMSVGSMLGGIGGGTDGTIGSLLGSGIGAAAGSFIPGVGTLIGGIAGGALGGLVGGLFGHKKNPYTLDNVMVSDGQLLLGNVFNQSETDGVTPQLSSDIASINAVLAANGLTASGGESYQGGNRLGYVGDDANNKDSSLRNLTLAQWLPDLHLSSSDATFQQALGQGMPSSFSSVADFTSAIASLKAMADTVDSLHVSVSKFNDDATVTVGHLDDYTGDLSTALNTALDGKTLSVSDLQAQIQTITSFVTDTMSGLMRVTAAGSESLMDQVEDLRAKYQAASDQAQQYGLDYQAVLDKGAAIAQQTLDRENQTLALSDQSVQARYLAATGDQQGADLMNFDVSAAQQRQQLGDQWQGYLGDAYASNVTYASQMADLDKTLAAERLSIQQQYADQSLQQQQQAAQSAGSVISSLSDYISGLGTSAASPLSAADQYKMANDNYTSDLGLAQGGDYTALSRMQQDIQTLLSTSQSYNGSGAAYGVDYQRVIQGAQSVGSISADALTTSAFASITKSANKELTDLLGQLLTVANSQLKEQKLQAMRKAS